MHREELKQAPDVETQQQEGLDSVTEGDMKEAGRPTG